MMTRLVGTATGQKRGVLKHDTRRSRPHVDQKERKSLSLLNASNGTTAYGGGNRIIKVGKSKRVKPLVKISVTLNFS